MTLVTVSAQACRTGEALRIRVKPEMSTNTSAFDAGGSAGCLPTIRDDARTWDRGGSRLGRLAPGRLHRDRPLNHTIVGAPTEGRRDVPLESSPPKPTRSSLSGGAGRYDVSLDSDYCDHRPDAALPFPVEEASSTNLGSHPARDLPMGPTRITRKGDSTPTRAGGLFRDPSGHLLEIITRAYARQLTPE